MKEQIKQEVKAITPLDSLEHETITDVLAWIDSGIGLCRLEKPATPDKHLVSYFVLVDGDFILLVDHINAQLWLPTGGHVEQNEHPRDAALREAHEELAIDGEFLYEKPLFITSTMTVGKTAGHTDVCLWYVLKGNQNMEISFNQSEFTRAKWFHKDNIPFDRTDSQLSRFLKKLYG